MTGLELLRHIIDELDRSPYLEKATIDLRDAANLIEVDQEKMVKDSPYDAIRPEDREAIAWVSEHGGVEHVRDIWDEMVNLCATIGCEPDIVTDAIEALGECTDIVNKRLMPPGMEWPRFEDGEKVKTGDKIETPEGVKTAGVFCFGYVATHIRERLTDVPFWAGGYSGPIRRPKQDPIGADGLHIHDDETVYLVDGNGDPLTVIGVETEGYQTVKVRKPTGYVINYDAQRLTHTKPAIGADGLPIKKGDTVYLLPGVWCDEYPCLGYHGGEELEVFEDGEPKHVKGAVQCRDKKKGALARGVCYPQPNQLTHTKPDIMGADGKPLKVGDTVWDIDGGEHELVITSIELDELEHVKATQEKPVPANVSIHPSRLTHTKPEPPDSWEQIYFDCDLTGEQYVEKRMEEQPDDMTPEMAKAHDLVRRAEEMAKRERE